MEKYSEFKNISLNETGLFDGSPRRMVSYNRLKKNQIETLEDLFNKFDNDEIDYGIDHPGNCVFEAKEVIGVVNLLRYKYLNVQLLINPLTNLSELARSNNRKKLVEYLKSIGLTHTVSVQSYFWVRKQHDKVIRLIDLLNKLKLERFYIGNYPACFQETLNEKVRLLIEHSETFILNVSFDIIEKYEKEFINPWFEIMNPSEVQAIHEYKRAEVTEAFKNVDWESYNDSVFLENDNDFYAYIKLKRKIKNNVGR